MIDSAKYLDIFRTLSVEDKYQLIKKLLHNIRKKNDAYLYLIEQIDTSDDWTDHILLIICEELLNIHDRTHASYQKWEKEALSRAQRRVMYLRSLQQHNRQLFDEEKEDLNIFIDTYPYQQDE